MCHNLSSAAVRVTKLVSMYMFLGVRNPILPIKNVSVSWKIYKQLFKRIFRAFLNIFVLVHGTERVTVHPPPLKVRDQVFFAH